MKVWYGEYGNIVAVGEFSKVEYGGKFMLLDAGGNSPSGNIAEISVIEVTELPQDFSLQEYCVNEGSLIKL